MAEDQSPPPEAPAGQAAESKAAPPEASDLLAIATALRLKAQSAFGMSEEFNVAAEVYEKAANPKSQNSDDIPQESRDLDDIHDEAAAKTGLYGRENGISGTALKKIIQDVMMVATNGNQKVADNLAKERGNY
jgi:hypothetical protein